MRALLWIALLAACGSTPTTLPTWDKTLPDARVMGTWRGLQPARGIVHLHSPYSHDACDGMPRDSVTGAPNEPCLADLRSALCTDHIDFAALTDHDASMADEEFATLFSMRGDDQPVLDGLGAQIASRMTCGDGHVVTFTVGGENDLMPVMLHRHPPGDVQTRHDIYNGNDPAAITAYRDAGGLAWVAHIESKPIDLLRTLLPDGIEVYNLHANIDPKLRPLLGLDPAGAVSEVVEFADTNPGHPEPDLALISFLAPSQPAIDRWTQLLGDGRHVAVTAGSDAHENALPVMLADGERGDSYRRVMRWFGNIVLVADPQDPAQVEAALGGGRAFAVFEIMGTPLGFDVHAEGSTTTELGGTAAVGDTLSVTVPTVRDLDPSLPAPEIEATIIHVDSGGATIVASGSGPTLSAPLAAPGAYRVEISIVPHHLGPYLADLGTAHADATLPWIYANPIYAQ